MIEVIAFDADDTLWYNETLYRDARVQFAALLSAFTDPEEAEQRLETIEVENIAYYGYGIKSFVLSMVEAAVDVTDGRISAPVLRDVIEIAKGMLRAPVRLFDQVQDTLAQLWPAYRLMLITKGDSFEQERKVTRSGLAPYFRYIEIVGEKSAETYRRLLQKYDIEPSQFLMVGNSMRSDIAPVVAIGATAVYVPYALTWSHEASGHDPLDRGAYYEIEHLGQLPALLAHIP